MSGEVTRTLRARLLVSGVTALLAACYVVASPLVFPAYTPDVDQLWVAARAWRDGRNPYDTVLAIHQARGLPFGLMYPFTAVALVLPLSFLPLTAARPLLAGLAAGCLAYVAFGRAWWLFPVLLSGAFRAAVSGVQLAPFVACAVLVPAFGWVAAAKPNVGIALWVASGDRRASLTVLVGAAALALLSFAAWPAWPFAWRTALATADYMRPIALHPFGWVVSALAMLRWRRPEARWLFAATLVPGTPAVYDALPLLVLVPRTLRQALVLAILSHVADMGSYALAGAAPSMAALADARAETLLWCLYLPAVALILRVPNQGAAPAWVERLTVRWPRWLRGMHHA